MEYKLDIKENAMDSLNEALAKFDLGERGDTRQYKFAILHFSHFLELVLKLYIESVDEHLLFSKCFKYIERRARVDSINLIEAYEKVTSEGFELGTLLVNISHPHTITLDQALEFSKHEKCSITDVNFVDIDFCDDIGWIKGLRNNIEHYQFRLSPKEARLCIGRLIRGVDEFTNIFDLFDLKSEVGEENYKVFEVLADEYAQKVKEGEREVLEKEADAYRGVRPKHYALIEWSVYECPECEKKTMIPFADSSTGYKCTICDNEDSDEIEVECDCCGVSAPSEGMDIWHTDDGSFEYRCYHCSGRYRSDKDD